MIHLMQNVALCAALLHVFARGCGRFCAREKRAL
jgi:hypothetical protein